jgi:alpha-D-xyloside xylohydrolase
MSSRAIYEGQRAARPDQRVFILTRSAFAGIQRYASATWSGDVASSWDALAKQIPAGLNFVLSGVPWWTTDIGGFAVRRRWARPDPDPADLAEWRELNTRWFQYSTFVPLLRSHGQYPRREMWFFGEPGEPAYDTQLAFARLRYRMLPYTYSLAARVTRAHDTMMRPLVMDFADDPRVLDIGDQFLLGPALMASPVYEHGARRRGVYLPAGSDWYDFWTGEHLSGGRTIDAAAPFERLPVHVRAGSIVPMGPELQYTGERPADPLTVWVYTGADASFELYEDDGETWDYGRGAFSIVRLDWSETDRVLTVGQRRGGFEAVAAARRLRVVFVSPAAPVGHAPEVPGAVEVAYSGSPVTVRAPVARASG